jgi:microcystin degradation protein MlrC
VREEFASGEFPLPREAVRMTTQAIASGATPVAIGDYSDRPGDATFILRELINQGVSNFIYGCLRDERALEALVEADAQAGDAFSMEVGGFTPSGGEPIRIEGTVAYFGSYGGYEHMAAIEFGNNNMLLLTPAYTQLVHPEQMRVGPVNPDNYEVFIVKSRAHFRRGFDETGFAKSIFVVDAPGSFVGTTRLDALDYQFAPLDKLYPFGTPDGR